MSLVDREVRAQRIRSLRDEAADLKDAHAQAAVASLSAQKDTDAAWKAWTDAQEELTDREKRRDDLLEEYVTTLKDIHALEMQQ